MTTPNTSWTRTEGDSWDIVSSVGFTALGVAAMRAIETNRPDRLVHDEFAEHFVRTAGEPHLVELLDKPEQAESGAFGSPRHMGLRSRFFDEFFLSAAKEGVQQAVILAAGLDARAHRLDWPQGQAVFEVDQPLVLAFKDQVLSDLGAKAKSDRREVAVDLREDWPAALRAAGFDPAAPTAWSAEGLLPYLPGAAQDLLFQRIVELSAPGSQIGVELFRGVFDVAAVRQVQDKYGLENDGPFQKVDISGLFYNDERADPVEWLAERGWSIWDRSPFDLAATYGVQIPELPEEVRELGERMRYFIASLPR